MCSLSHAYTCRRWEGLLGSSFWRRVLGPDGQESWRQFLVKYLMLRYYELF